MPERDCTSGGLFEYGRMLQLTLTPWCAKTPPIEIRNDIGHLDHQWHATGGRLFPFVRASDRMKVCQNSADRNSK